MKYFHHHSASRTVRHSYWFLHQGWTNAVAGGSPSSYDHGQLPGHHGKIQPCLVPRKDNAANLSTTPPADPPPRGIYQRRAAPSCCGTKPPPQQQTLAPMATMRASIPILGQAFTPPKHHPQPSKNATPPLHDSSHRRGSAGAKSRPDSCREGHRGYSSLVQRPTTFYFIFNILIPTCLYRIRTTFTMSDSP